MKCLKNIINNNHQQKIISFNNKNKNLFFELYPTRALTECLKIAHEMTSGKGHTEFDRPLNSVIYFNLD